MIVGLDTNVLVRYLTQDDPAQAAIASRAIDSAQPGTLFISSIVICETVWVLEDAYRRKRDDISRVLEMILQTAQFVFEDKDLLWKSLADYRRGKGDLSDYLIGHVASDAGCAHTISFDRALKGSHLFRVL